MHASHNPTFKSTFEPFRIKTVERIKPTTRDERVKYLEEAHYNPFLVKSKDVLIDLLTDSGTGAMSTDQWAAIMVGDEMYAGSSSYYKFEAVVKEICGYTHVLPTHQGRAAERILLQCTLTPGDIVPNNSHFDTTRANVEAYEATAVSLPSGEDQLCKNQFFKGNMDIARLEELLKDDQYRVPLVFLTITDNARGGFAVSMSNIKAVSKLCHAHNIPLFFDACRFAENAWFIKESEAGYEDKTVKEIAQEIFSWGDGCTMSAKKNGLVNIGGFLAMNSDRIAERCRTKLIVSEGFLTYGGLAGRDMEAIAVGLNEMLDESYLDYQISFTRRLADMLKANNVPVLSPPGGHAVYIDAAEMLPHIPKKQFPAWALNCELYLAGGVRAGEIGGVMFNDDAGQSGNQELLRLAIPRRVYTESHLRYVAEVLGYVANNRQDIPGYKITWSPKVLRHFTARFRPVTSNNNDDPEMINHEKEDQDSSQANNCAGKLRSLSFI